MPKPPAFVVTHALSAGAYFPLWHKYYAEQIGAQNIFIVTDPASKNGFDQFENGGVYSLPNDLYDENIRVKVISSIVQGLLECYETALVVDTDEFLIPDPRSYAGILEYLDRHRGLYMTSIGCDLTQIKNEPPLNLNNPILGKQRNFAFLNSSLCKTSVTRIPLIWGVGYHYCSVYPVFSEIFLVHMKRADIEMQFRWLERMSTLNIPTQQIRDYYRVDRNKIENYHDQVGKRPVRIGWNNMYDDQFFSAYFKEVALDKSGIYRGKHFSASTLFELPTEFAGRL